MIRSETPTGYLLVKARSSSDDDPCDFALISMYSEDFTQLQDIQTATNDHDLRLCTGFSVTVDHDIRGYFRTGGALSIMQLTEVLDGLHWAFVVVSEEEIEDLLYPDAELTEQRLEMRPSGAFKFFAVGDTDTRFETSELHMNELSQYFS